MKEIIPKQAEREAASAFNKQAPHFDELFGNDVIVAYKRKRVRDLVLSRIGPASNILELNAGTGEDAIFFAQLGHTVHATDISESMQAKLSEKAGRKGLHMNIGNEVISFTSLEKLTNRGPFDLVFSNFGGLNCTPDLAEVLVNLDPLVTKGGWIILVIMPPFCLWEFACILKGKFRTAFRRFAGRKGAVARIEGETFRCWYYSPSFVRRHIGESFEHIATEGLCCLVPPSWFRDFAVSYPRLFRTLDKLEHKWKARWPFRGTGDYYIITFRKK